jgi:hypothetical protein
MAITKLTLDPEVSRIVTTAFDKSWQFVRTPTLSWRTTM